MASRLPLSMLLSQALVAFTIEFDNEFERRMPHQTTTGRSGEPRRGPWLVSQVMWANVLRYVSPEGLTIGQLHARVPGPPATRWPGSSDGGTPASNRPRPPRAGGD